MATLAALADPLPCHRVVHLGITLHAMLGNLAAIGDLESLLAAILAAQKGVDAAANAALSCASC
jgi:hypothetical protein